jgi:hypothetical protein
MMFSRDELIKITGAIVLKDEVLPSQTFAISTEYIKFYSDIKFNIEEEIKCSLILPKDYGIIDFIAKISEIDAIYSNEYTAIYVTMTEANRQTLLYYMYMYSKDTD